MAITTLMNPNQLLTILVKAETFAVLHTVYYANLNTKRRFKFTTTEMTKLAILMLTAYCYCMVHKVDLFAKIVILSC